MVTMQCPNPTCGRSFDISEELLGRSGRCKRCGTRFTLSQSGDQRSSMGSAGSGPAFRPAGPIDSDIPERLGRFEVRSRLGAGAFGTVYRAFDPVLNREVALKVPLRRRSRSPEAIQRFLREAQAAAQLRHPNIVPVYDAGTDGSHDFIASAFIAGQNLAEVIDANNRGLDPRRAARIVRDLAEALHYAHGRGIVHRDVKPANVMLDDNDCPLLMDFGLARLASSDSGITREGAIVGTPAYMAPEQAGGREADAASDQYSLGITLYELLCGQTPFAGPPQFVLFNAIHSEPVPPRGVNPEVPPGLDAICLKAIAKPPEARYASCRELAIELRQWLDEPHPSPGLEVPVTPTIVRRRERAGLILGLGSASSLVLGVIGLAVFYGQTKLHPILESDAGRDARTPGRTTGQDLVPPQPPLAMSPERLTETVLDAKPWQLANLVPLLRPDRGQVVPALLKQLEISSTESTSEAAVEIREGRVANAAAALSYLGEAQPVRSLLGERTPSRKRSYVLNSLTALAMPPDVASLVDEETAWALRFDGRTGSCIRTPLKYAGKSPLTLEVVFMARGNGTIVGDCQQGGIALGIEGGGRLNVIVWVGGGYKRASSQDRIDPARPHHAAAVFDPDRQLRLYLDGKLQGEPLATVGRFKPSPYVVTVGADLTLYRGQRGPTPDHRFKGDIKEIRITQGARYTADFQPERRLAGEKTTLLLYHLDEGQGTTVYDTSGNRRHGTVTNGQWVRSPDR